MLARALIGTGLALALVLGGCTIPRAGPSVGDFSRADADNRIDLVDVTPADLPSFGDGVFREGFSSEWKQPTPDLADMIGPGDRIDVTIFERDGLNMFPAGQDGASRLTGLAVDSRGLVQLPYIGNVAVGGLTTNGARGVILSRLRRVALSSDVLVNLAERHSQLISVQGDVTKPGMVPLGPETRKLTSLLGTAAPTPTNLEQATVTVRRGASAVTLPLVDIFERPEEDIALRAGDVVIVRNAVAAVSVLGAAGLQGRVRITRRGYSLVDAVADARGLNDAAANPSAIYLMRLSDKATVLAERAKVYRFDFRDPAQIALASAFPMRDGDAVLIPNASFTQTQKVLSAFAGVLQTARSASVIAP